MRFIHISVPLTWDPNNERVVAVYPGKTYRRPHPKYATAEACPTERHRRKRLRAIAFNNQQIEVGS